MARKYYAYFVYGGEEYVMRFKIAGTLQYRKKERCFIDREWYVRTISDVVAYAARDTNPHNDKRFGFCMLIPQKTYMQERAKGTKRWIPENKVIRWD